MITSTAFLSRSEAEACRAPLADKTSLISIVSPAPDTRPVDFSKSPFTAVLQLQFHDVDPKGCSEEWKAKYTLFGRDQAKAIIEFINTRNALDTALWVHCEAGISRSAGVAKFIAEKLMLPFLDSYSLYNKHVYRTLVDFYYRGYK